MSGFVDVGSADDLRATGRLLAQLPPAEKGGDPRYLAVISHKGSVHAIDATCYHMGGPLVSADIEDIDGFGSCIVCPWHRYQISLETGQKLYMDIKGTMKTNGEMKQRVHDVKLDGGRILVKPNLEGTCVSDEYACKRPAPSQMGTAVRSGNFMGGGVGGARGRGGGRASASGRMAPPSFNQMVSNSMRGGDGVAPWGYSSDAAPVVRAGKIDSSSSSSGGSGGGGLLSGGASAAMLSKDYFTPFMVVSTRMLNRNHVVFRVKVTGAVYSFGLGNHVELSYQGVTRMYTPYLPPSTLEPMGTGDDGKQQPLPNTTEVEFFVKVYGSGELTPLLAGLKTLNKVSLRGAIKGPLPSGFLSARKDGTRLALNMVAGGTGITPFLQIVYGLVGRDPKHHCVRRATLLYCCASSDDVLHEEEMAKVRAHFGSFLDFSFVVAVSSPSPSPPPASQWLTGRVSPEMLGKVVPADAGSEDTEAHLMYCGPPSFNDVVAEMAASVGYAKDRLHEFS
eukprot:Rhum_TRINITY_DN15620_c0_g1::Rhum_TRINITY_DN15620_c0_g1_i1::g.161685::m.161685